MDHIQSIFVSNIISLYCLHVNAWQTLVQGAKGVKPKLTKEEVKRREEALVKEIIADMMDSHGGYEKPQV